MTFNKDTFIGLVALVIAIVGCYLPVASAVKSFGALPTCGGQTSCTTGNLYVSGQLTGGTLQVGASGTSVASVNAGYCDLNFGITPASFVASTSQDVDCQGTNMLASATAVQAALPGVAAWSATAGGAMSVMLASSTPATYLGIHIEGCSASSTAGYLTCQVTNATGAAFTPATTTTHFVQYLVTN